MGRLSNVKLQELHIKFLDLIQRGEHDTRIAELCNTSRWTVRQFRKKLLREREALQNRKLSEVDLRQSLNLVRERLEQEVSSKECDHKLLDSLINRENSLLQALAMIETKNQNKIDFDNMFRFLPNPEQKQKDALNQIGDIVAGLICDGKTAWLELPHWKRYATDLDPNEVE